MGTSTSNTPAEFGGSVEGTYHEPFLSLPMPARFVPQVTAFLASLYSAEAAKSLEAADAPVRNGEVIEVQSPDPLAVDPAPANGADVDDDLNGLRVWSGPHPVWAEETYEALIKKGDVSSDRMVAFMDHLGVGRENALEIPAVAERIAADGRPMTAENINVALRWFGKFTRKSFPGVEGHVWPFEIGGQDYPKGYTGSRHLLFWLEPEQDVAWREARSA